MTMDYLIRFIQIHETFRKPEIDALAVLAGLEIEWKHYSADSPFAIISLRGENIPNDAAARLITRSILCTSIHELWGVGVDHDGLREDVFARSSSLWKTYEQVSFRFDIDSFRGSRTLAQKRELIESCSYIKLNGPIIMKNPDCIFTIFEVYEHKAAEPDQFYVGRLVAESDRRAIHTYNLKKRKYISTTSMDAELSLVTANLALAAPGKLAYDPFMGTGSFPVSCAHFGAVTFGSDLDGRSIRGTPKKNVASNFAQYGTSAHYLGGLVADVTNTPLANRQILDIILCDPPYGVREGLKVLGHFKERLQDEVILSDGTPAHLKADYVPPKRPYSFVRMLDDILDFSATRLVSGGRLCMWMPVAGAKEDVAAADKPQPSVDDAQSTDAEDMQEYDIPQHPALELITVCQQDFNKWSRHLLTYSRRSDSEINADELADYLSQRLAIAEPSRERVKADDLNDFRKKYFEGFKR